MKSNNQFDSDKMKDVFYVAKHQFNSFVEILEKLIDNHWPMDIYSVGIFLPKISVPLKYYEQTLELGTYIARTYNCDSVRGIDCNGRVINLGYMPIFAGHFRSSINIRQDWDLLFDVSPEAFDDELIGPKYNMPLEVKWLKQNINTYLKDCQALRSEKLPQERKIFQMGIELSITRDDTGVIYIEGDRRDHGIISGDCQSYFTNQPCYLFDQIDFLTYTGALSGECLEKENNRFVPKKLVLNNQTPNN